MMFPKPTSVVLCFLAYGEIRFSFERGTATNLFHFSLGAGLLLVGLLVWSFDAWMEKWERATFAENVLANLERGSPVPRYSLYLRPFFTSDRLVDINDTPNTSPAAPGYFYTPKDFDLEESLSGSLKGWAPLIGVGPQASRVGAGTVEVSTDSWKESVASLAKVATFIFVFPGYQAGTLWEIEYLKDKELFRKTAFIRPWLGKKAMSQMSIEEHWRRTQSAFAVLGLTLPPLMTGGYFFSLNDNGSLRHCQPIGRFTPKSKRRLRDLLTQLELSTDTTALTLR
jgi:hypothetical protein